MKMSQGGIREILHIGLKGWSEIFSSTSPMLSLTLEITVVPTSLWIKMLAQTGLAKILPVVPA